MSTLQELGSSSTLFGGNAPFIEEQYERYLADPATVSSDWRAYFDSLRGEAADVAHGPVIESFIRLAKHRKVAGAMVDATTMHKQVLVLQLIGKFRTLGMFHADLDPLKRQENPYIADLDLATYGFTNADLDTEFDVGSFKAGAQRMRLRDLIAALKDTYCRTLGAAVHVHPGNGDQALHPGAAGADPLEARRTAPSSGATSSSVSPRRKRSSATCTRSTSARSASPARAGSR